MKPRFAARNCGWRADLAEFEQQFGWASAEFWRKYQAGETDDRMDYVEWASLFQMAQRLEQRLLPIFRSLVAGV